MKLASFCGHFLQSHFVGLVARLLKRSGRHKGVKAERSSPSISQAVIETPSISGVDHQLRRVSVLNPILRILRLVGAQFTHVLCEVLCCPHASDHLADAFSVANPVVLEALWSGCESGSGSFHALYPC